MWDHSCRFSTPSPVKDETNIGHSCWSSFGVFCSCCLRTYPVCCWMTMQHVWTQRHRTAGIATDEYRAAGTHVNGKGAWNLVLSADFLKYWH